MSEFAIVPVAAPLLKTAPVMTRMASSGGGEDEETRETTEKKFLLRAQLSALMLLDDRLSGVRLLEQRRSIAGEPCLNVELLVRVMLV